MAVQMTKFTSKQAGVIYRAYKTNEIETTKDAMSRMYDLVNNGNEIDWNGSINREIQDLKIAVEAIFNKDYEKAQEHINRFMAA